MHINKIIYFPILLFLITASNIFSQPQPPIDGMSPLEMKITEDGKRIIAAYETCTIVWDISKREILRRIPRYLSYYPDYFLSVKAINQDGTILAVGNNQILSLYNTENNRLIKQINVFEYIKDPNTTDSHGFSTMIGWQQEEFSQIYFTPDNKYLIIISNDDRIKYVDLIRYSIISINASNDIELPRPTMKGDILDFNISIGKAVFLDNFSIIIFNILSGRKEGDILRKYNNSDFRPISFSLNNNKNKPSVMLAINNNWEYYLLFCDIDKRTIINAKKLNGVANIVKFTSDDNIVALARNNYICLYNIQSGNEIARLVAYEEPKPPNTPQPTRAQTRTLWRTIQLGSFSSFVDAFRLVKNMEEEGFKPFIERTKTNNTTSWCVVINNIPDKELTFFSDLVKNAGFTNILLRDDISEMRQ